MGNVVGLFGHAEKIRSNFPLVAVWEELEALGDPRGRWFVHVLVYILQPRNRHPLQIIIWSIWFERECHRRRYRNTNTKYWSSSRIVQLQLQVQLQARCDKEPLLTRI